MNFRQYCYVANTAQQCRLGLFQDSDFEETLTTRSQHQGRICAFSEAEHLCQQVGCARNKPSDSHSSTEAEVIYLDAGLRMDGSPALDLWDLVIEVLHSSPN